MQFSELFVLSEFTKDFFPNAPPKKMEFSHYSKEFKTYPIMKNICHELNPNESQNLSNVELSKHLIKKNSFDVISTMKKCLEKEKKEPKIHKKALSNASTGSGSSFDHTSYFSCMPILEVFKADEPTKSLNILPELKQNDCIKEGTKLNYDDLKRKLQLKIKNQNFKTEKVSTKNNTELEFKLHSKYFEKKQFSKQSQENILRNFDKNAKKQSNLSTKIYQLCTSPKLRKSPRLRAIKIFPFGSSAYLEVNVGRMDTVQNLLEKIIQKYMNDPQTNKSLLQFPTKPTAYELRYLNEDDGCKPDLTLEPLEETQNVLDYFLDSVAFGLKENNKSINKEMGTKYAFDEILEISDNDNSTKSKSALENLISIEVTFKQENVASLIDLDIDKTVTDLLKEIKLKNKSINFKNYVIFEDFDDIEGMENEGSRELDLKMPLKNLISRKLHIVEKKFADDPIHKSNSKGRSKNQESIYASENFTGKSNLSKILLNEIIACKTEEFELNQISSKHKNRLKQKKLIIDQIKLTLKKHHDSLETSNQDFWFGIPNLYHILTHTKSNHQDILLENILDIDMMEDDFTILRIDYRNPEKKNENESMFFEFDNPTTSLYVLAKVRFLINFLSKKKHKNHAKVRKTVSFL